MIASENIIPKSRMLINKYGIQNILVTRSRDGMTLVMKDGSIHNIPATAKEVYDVTGAGDTVVAVLALAIAAGLQLPEAAMLANIAGGIVVGKIGTATVTHNELKEAL